MLILSLSYKRDVIMAIRKELSATIEEKFSESHYIY